ncbi:unnamed protein product, partial [Cuscuta campestris]
MVQIRPLIEPQILWKIYDGSLSFWWDNWTGLGSLAVITNQAQGKYWLVPLKNFVNKALDLAQLQQLMDPGFFIHFQVDLSLFGSPFPDKAIWQPKATGEFSLKAVKQFLRPSGQTDIYLQNYWHKHIPFKVSFLCWRVHLRKLPLDTILYRFGHSFPSKCYCCTKPDRESTEHVFAQGDVARAVWNYFCDLFGMDHGCTTIKQYLDIWWGSRIHSKKPTVRQLLKQCIPAFIVWELWVHYASLKFGEKQ